MNDLPRPALSSVFCGAAAGVTTAILSYRLWAKLKPQKTDPEKLRDPDDNSDLPRGSWRRSQDVPIGSLTHFPEGAEVQMSFRRKSFMWDPSEHLCGRDIIPWCDRVDTIGDLIFYGGVEIVKEGVSEIPNCFSRKYARDMDTGHIQIYPKSSSQSRSSATSPRSTTEGRDFRDAMLKSDELFQKGIRELTPALPSWVDFDLLQEGCDFYAATWPFVSYSFSWAVIGGFGSEQASEVLLKTRYWGGIEPKAASEAEKAAAVEAGRIDTWQRLRETLCFLYDISCLGAQSFRPELDGEAFRSCTRVRWLHARTRAHVWNTCHPVSNDEWYSMDSEAGGGKGEIRIVKTAYDEEKPESEGSKKNSSPWNSERLGEPVSQGELVGTLLGSSVLILDGMEELAFKQILGGLIPLRKKEAFLHLWKVVGYLFGIEEDVLDRCCRDYRRAALVADSLLLLGIPRNPAREITGVLVNHIVTSVCAGIKHEFGQMGAGFWYLAPSPETFSMPSWIFLGKEHGEAIFLPTANIIHWIVGYWRRTMLGFCLLSVLGWQKVAAGVGVGDGLLLKFMKHAFGKTVDRIQKDQPKCRFGKKCPFAKPGTQ